MIQFDEHMFQRGWFNHQPDDHAEHPMELIFAEHEEREFYMCPSTICSRVL